jgi:hypothetical protein
MRFGLMGTQLTIETRDKLKKLIPMLSSDQDGEVLGTVAAIKRVLQSDGKDLIDLSKTLTKKEKEPKPPQTKSYVFRVNGKVVKVVSAAQLDLFIQQQYADNLKLKAEIKKLKEAIDDRPLIRPLIRPVHLIWLLFVVWIIFK